MGQIPSIDKILRSEDNRESTQPLIIHQPKHTTYQYRKVIVAP